MAGFQKKKYKCKNNIIIKKLFFYNYIKIKNLTNLEKKL